jgi:hypothetical protein
MLGNYTFEGSGDFEYYTTRMLFTIAMSRSLLTLVIGCSVLVLWLPLRASSGLSRYTLLARGDVSYTFHVQAPPTTTS